MYRIVPRGVDVHIYYYSLLLSVDETICSYYRYKEAGCTSSGSLVVGECPLVGGADRLARLLLVLSEPFVYHPFLRVSFCL